MLQFQGFVDKLGVHSALGVPQGRRDTRFMLRLHGIPPRGTSLVSLATSYGSPPAPPLRQGGWDASRAHALFWFQTREFEVFELNSESLS